MKNGLQMMVASTLLMGMVAWSTTEEKQAEQKVEQAVSAEKPATQKGELAARGSETFLNAPGLTEVQKSKLMAIHSRTAAEAQAIGAELTQTKSALFKSLVSPTSTAKEIKILKDRIVALDRKRLDTMFKSLDEVQKIVGKNEQSEDLYKEFYHIETTNRGRF